MNDYDAKTNNSAALFAHINPVELNIFQQDPLPEIITCDTTGKAMLFEKKDKAELEHLMDNVEYFVEGVATLVDEGAHNGHISKQSVTALKARAVDAERAIVQAPAYMRKALDTRNYVEVFDAVIALDSDSDNLVDEILPIEQLLEETNTKNPFAIKKNRKWVFVTVAAAAAILLGLGLIYIKAGDKGMVGFITEGISELKKFASGLGSKLMRLVTEKLSGWVNAIRQAQMMAPR